MNVVVGEGDTLPAPILARAASLLREGELLIFPTDTLYAVGGLCTDARAALRVRAAKGRDPGHPLPAVAADEEQARRLSGNWPDAARALAASFWPGPLTVVVEAASVVPPEVHAGTRSIAVRVPAREVTRALCRLAGPLLSTSANRSGEPSPAGFAEAVQAVGTDAALRIDGGPSGTRASTIVDLTGPTPRLVREGAVSWAEVVRVWGAERPLG